MIASATLHELARQPVNQSTKGAKSWQMQLISRAETTQALPETLLVAAAVMDRVNKCTYQAARRSAAWSL